MGQFVSTKVGGGIQLLESEIAKDAMLLEREVEKDLVAVEKDIVAVEGRIERGVIKDEQQVVSFFKGLKGPSARASSRKRRCHSHAVCLTRCARRTCCASRRARGGR